MVKITGTCTAMIVPFRENGSIDYNLYEKMCLRQALNGNHIVSPGTTTESPTLSPQEHLDLIKIGAEVKNEVNSNNSNLEILMIAGVGSNSTKEAIEYCEESLKVGADAGMSVVPYYNKPSQKGHLEHQREIAEVGLPIMIYNIPGRSASGMSSQTLLKAFEHDNIVSLKAADGVNEELINVLRSKPENITVLSGDDTLTHPMLSLGAEGVVSVTSNLIPKSINSYISNYDGSKKSKEEFMELFPIFQANMEFGNPATIKEAMYIFRNEIGFNSYEPHLRKPLVRIEPEHSKKLESILRKDLNLFK